MKTLRKLIIIGAGSLIVVLLFLLAVQLLGGRKYPAANVGKPTASEAEPHSEHHIRVAKPQLAETHELLGQYVKPGLSPFLEFEEGQGISLSSWVSTNIANSDVPMLDIRFWTKDADGKIVPELEQRLQIYSFPIHEHQRKRSLGLFVSDTATPNCAVFRVPIARLTPDDPFYAKVQPHNRSNVFLEPGQRYLLRVGTGPMRYYYFETPAAPEKGTLSYVDIRADLPCPPPQELLDWFGRKRKTEGKTIVCSINDPTLDVAKLRFQYILPDGRACPIVTFKNGVKVEDPLGRDVPLGGTLTAVMKNDGHYYTVFAVKDVQERQIEIPKNSDFYVGVAKCVRLRISYDVSSLSDLQLVELLEKQRLCLERQDCPGVIVAYGREDLPPPTVATPGELQAKLLRLSGQPKPKHIDFLFTVPPGKYTVKKQEGAVLGTVQVVSEQKDNREQAFEFP